MQFMSLRFQGWKFALWFMATQCQDYGINCDIWRSVLWRACVGTVGHGLNVKVNWLRNFDKAWPDLVRKRMETVNDHVIKNDVCNTCSQNSTRSATYFFESHGGQGVSRWPMHRFCFEVYGRSARNHHCTEETHRAESWVMRQTLLPHSLSLHEFQYISIHTVFIWFICIPTLCLSLVRISVPNFWYTFLLPTRRVSGPNRWRVFRIKGYRYTPDPLRTTTKSRHWVSWKQVKVATTRPEASRSESG